MQVIKMLYRKVQRGYRLNYPISYYSKRYQKRIKIPVDYFSDGATGAFDIFSESWWIHDKICDTGKWEDGTRITNWQASRVISDILWQEKRFFRSGFWLIATFLRGGGEARKNGMFKLKKEKQNDS